MTRGPHSQGDLFAGATSPVGAQSAGAVFSAVSAGAPVSPSVRRVSLVRLAGEIARAFSVIGRIAVPGEVVKLQRRPNGRAYFTLKDRAASLTVSVPAKVAAKSRLRDGERVQVTGRLDWWSDGGRAQLLADEVVPVGEGAVAAWIEEVRARLTADGLVGRPRRPLPLLPGLVAVVCGADAAVRHDITSVVAERFAGYPVRFLETKVSGPGAAASIVEALGRLDADPAVEVIILARGGGDATQLLAWSDEDLCRAVAGCATPVVSAIGHHEDRPLCDEVADLRCGTPSIAAAAVIPHRADLTGRLDRALQAAGQAQRTVSDRSRVRLQRVDVSRALTDAHLRARHQLDRAGHRLAATHPRHLVAGARHQLGWIDWQAPLARRLERAGDRLTRLDWWTPLVRRVNTATGELRRLDGRIEALSPAAVLARGYAVVRTTRGEVIRDPSGTQPGDTLDVQVAGGRLTVTVQHVHPSPSRSQEGL